MATDPMLDPDYKYSINKFTGNGSKTSWDLNFSGGYIRREHVKAYTEAADGQITELSFTWSGPNTIVITPPVANGLRLFVYRDTPKNGPLVDFTDGAIINEYDLDMLARQTVFATAEMVDRFADVAIQADGATAVATEALIRAADAQDKVALANSTSSAALLAAQGAVTTANTANANAANAVGVAGAANATAGAANTKADTAIATANTALSNANAATGIANTAAGQAASAVTVAGAANTKADNAVTRALDAQASAANATTIATGAAGTANQVRTEFDDLRDTVEEIAGSDLSSFVKVNVENNFSAVQRFYSSGRPGIEIWDTPGGNGLRFGPGGGISFAENGVWPTGVNFANLKDALYRDREGVLPALTVTNEAQGGVATGWGGKFYAAGDGLHIALGGGRDVVFRSDNGNMVVPGNFFADGNKPVWHSGNLNPSSFAAAVHTHAWASIEGKPSVFTPADHTHNQYALASDAVLISATNLGRNIGVVRTGFKFADMAAAPSGYIVMSGPGSDVPGGGHGHFFKFGRRDSLNGWRALWSSHGGRGTHYIMGTDDASQAAWMDKLWTSYDLPRPTQWAGGHPVEFYVNDGRLGFNAPSAGVNSVLAVRGSDEQFRDLTAQRGDGSGAIFLGGGSYIYHNTSGEYEFGGNKPVNANAHFKLTQPWNRIFIAGAAQPKITVNAAEPSEKQVGDLWAW